MEALLVASGVLLAAQYKRNPSQFRIPSHIFPLKQAGDDKELENISSEQADNGDEQADNGDISLEEAPSGKPVNTSSSDRMPVSNNGRKMDIVSNDYHFYPDDFFNNVLPHRQAGYPPSMPRPVPGRRVPGGGVVNPVEVDMMNDIRTGNNRIPAAATALASAFRPSWVRNVVDKAPSGKQEREQDLFQEIPREAQIHTLPSLTQRYGKHGVATLNQYDRSALPFDEQIRVRPDGLDPDPTRRMPTARYNTYALGDDLTRSMPDYGKVPGLAQGQRVEGISFRDEAWDVMPDRGIQLEPSNQPIPLNGAGVRSNGRGAQLGSFLGSAPSPNTSKPGIEWDSGPTANKGIIPKLPVRSTEDQIGKRFEDIDSSQTQSGVSRKFEVPKATSLLSEKGAWKFSFDIKTLFDMPNHEKKIVETAPEKIVSLPENTRASIKKGTSQSKRRNVTVPEDVQKIFETAPEKFVAVPSKTRTFIQEGAAESKRRNVTVPEDVQKIFETAPEKFTPIPEKTRTFIQEGAAESKRRNVNPQPQKQKIGLFGASTYKTETLSGETVISSSDILVGKNIATEQSNPLGDNATGRRMAVEKSDAPIKRGAINDVQSFDNDKIFERGGTLREPMAAPKTDEPDYAFSKVNAARNGREFRRR